MSTPQPFIGIQALRKGDWRAAAELLEQALGVAPDNRDLQENLAEAWLELGRFDDAERLLEQVLQHQPAYFVSRLLLGQVRLRQGRRGEAMAHLQWALRQARKRGFWRNDESIQPWLRERVQAAGRFLRDYKLERVHHAVPVLAAGDPALSRVRAFVRAQLGIERVKPEDPRQAPKQHYLPGMPASPWLDPGLFPWARELEAAFPDILREYQALAADQPGFEPFLEFRSPEQVPKYLGTTGPAPRWDAFFFQRHGERNEENCRRCPVTTAVLDRLPLVRIPEVAPEILFSLLTPGTHILPHRGVSNLRSTVHLGLVIPENCVLKVAGEERTWQPGKVLAFDDTYEHEAWNRSQSVRVVLLMDAWNPHLTEAEIRVLPEVVRSLNEIGAEIQRYKPAVP